MTDSAVPTPKRARPRRAVVAFDWKRPEEVPGGVLPPDVQRRLQERLAEITECQGRALVRARSYYIR